jgi:transcriptional regulator with XRE-family HTH domain
MSSDDGANLPSGKRSRSFRVVGPLLRSLRVARGWSQQDAAERAGVSDRLIRKAEAGEPIELQSIALLSQLYSTPEARLTPRELLADALPGVGKTPEAAGHEALVRRWFEEVWNQGRLEAIDELAWPDCVLHADGAVLHGTGEVRQRTEAIRAAFSDFEMQVEHIAVQGDMIISRWRVAMTHTGPWMETPPTNKRIIVRGSTWMRVEGGLLREGWDFWEQQQATNAVQGGPLPDAPPAKAARKPRKRR